MSQPSESNNSLSTIALFKKVKLRQYLVGVLVALAAVPFVLIKRGKQLPEVLGIPQDVVIGIIIAVVVGGLLFSFYNRRCPKCTSYLGKSFNPTFCPSCGEKLSD